MKRAIFDTNILTSYWHREALWKLSNAAVKRAALKLKKSRDAEFIVTPVYIEFIVGATTGARLTLMRTFLAEFKVLDGGTITNEDWVEARRFAERIPPDGKPRHMGDCLIKAIANRRNYEVLTSDARFAR
jgi:predicted nucleic acid-binding protein